MIVRRLLYWLTARLPVKVRMAERHTTDPDRTPLYERYFVCRLPRGGCVYIHHYLRSDPDRGPHDHPWNWAIAIPLARGYTEETVEGWTSKGPRTVNRRRRPLVPRLIDGYELHRIILPEGETSWSLFIHGPYSKGWGFLRPVTPLHLVLNYPEPGASKRPSWTFRAIRENADDNPDWWSAAPIGREIARAAP